MVAEITGKSADAAVRKMVRSMVANPACPNLEIGTRSYIPTEFTWYESGVGELKLMSMDVGSELSILAWMGQAEPA